MHLPFVCWENVEAIIKFIRKVRPTYIIQIGDLYDFFSWTRYPFKRDVYTPEAEIGLGREMAEDFWSRAINASANTKRYQLKGNHDDRPYKRLTEKCPELFSIARGAIDKLFHFDGVETIGSSRDELILEEIVFMHGFRPNLGDHAKHNRLSTVCGHSHLGGCVSVRQGDSTIWELNCGFVGDEYSEPLSYTHQRRFSKWTQGFGYIDEFGPRFISLQNRKCF